MCGAIHWLLHGYVTALGQPYRGEKTTLQMIRDSDPDLLADLELASSTGPMEKRLEALERATEKALAPVGGSWQHGEVLFFAEQGKEHLRSDAWRHFWEELVSA